MKMKKIYFNGRMKQKEEKPHKKTYIIINFVFRTIIYSLLYIFVTYLDEIEYNMAL